MIVASERSLSRIRSSGLKLSSLNCVFGVDKMTYLNSRQSQTRSTQNFSNLRYTCTQKQIRILQRFLGIVTYLRKILLTLSTTTVQLREVLEKDTDCVVFRRAAATGISKVKVRVFACKRFLYGPDFLVENDHKPLQTLFLKSIVKTPPCIQCGYKSINLQ